MKKRTVYENLHILGYYRGDLNVDILKAGFRHTKFIIDTFKALLIK
mgnify:CR=1 FL=1